MPKSDFILFDAGLFIGALLQGDPRHQEARPIVEAARAGNLPGCTTTSILSEVYAALTWVNAQPPHTPQEAAAAIRLLVEPPSEIIVLADSLDTSITMLLLAEKYELTARRVHDARHAATALENGVKKVFTYDTSDWKIFTPEGLSISGPPSVLSKSLQDKSVNE